MTGQNAAMKWKKKRIIAAYPLRPSIYARLADAGLGFGKSSFIRLLAGWIGRKDAALRAACLGISLQLGMAGKSAHEIGVHRLAIEAGKPFQPSFRQIGGGISSWAERCACRLTRSAISWDCPICSTNQDIPCSAQKAIAANRKSIMSLNSSKVRLDQFDPRFRFSRGRPVWVFLLWYFLKCVFFLSPIPWPAELRSILLRWFGATVGSRVYWKPRVNIHFPWKLTVGDHCWVGEEVCIYNFEPVTIGSHCCLSQRVMVCCGNHDYRRPDMAYRNAPITLADGVWIGAQSFLGPGLTVGVDTDVAAGSVVTSDLPAGLVCQGNPCIAVRRRWKTE